MDRHGYGSAFRILFGMQAMERGRDALCIAGGAGMKTEAGPELKRPFQTVRRNGPTVGEIRMCRPVRTLDHDGFVNGDTGRIDVRAKGIKPAEWIIEGLAQSLYRAISECRGSLYRI